MSRLHYALSDVELRRHNIFLALDIGLIDAATAERLLGQLTTAEEELGWSASAQSTPPRYTVRRSRLPVTRN
jgi:hypothetical protein